MPDKLDFHLVNKYGYMVDVDFFSVRKPGTGKETPLLIFCHGFKGFKDWGGFPYLMEKFSALDISAASFNFSFNGVGTNNPTEFTRLDLFAQNTFTRELEDLELVIDYFFLNSEKLGIDNEKITLAGHSRGGGISIIKANEDNRIKCLITLSSVSDFNRYSEENKKLWRKRGFIEVLNSRTNQLMRINVSLLDDLEKNKDKLDIQSAVKNLRIPLLIIHGTEDLSVRFEEAETLYKRSNKQLTEFFPVPNTGHTYGISHPFEGSTGAFDTVIEKMTEFIKRMVG
jgi:pimeloyl-ACP methyl ester carboxylesterase